MSNAKLTRPKLEPLKLTCTSADCDNGLHCFKATRAMKKENKSGACRSCGIELVDWLRLHKKDAQDTDYTFRSLKRELIRHHFWHVQIDDKAIAHARRKGNNGMRAAARARISKYVAPAKPV